MNSSTPAYIPLDPNFVPRDDASVANYIAKQYKEAGIDPMSAYDDPADAVTELGL